MPGGLSPCVGPGVLAFTPQLIPLQFFLRPTGLCACFGECTEGWRPWARPWKLQDALGDPTSPMARIGSDQLRKAQDCATPVLPRRLCLCWAGGPGAPIPQLSFPITRRWEEGGSLWALMEAGPTHHHSQPSLPRLLVLETQAKAPAKGGGRLGRT